MNTDAGVSLLISTNGGRDWETTEQAFVTMFLPPVFDRVDPKTFYVLSDLVYKTIDAGQTFTTIRAPYVQQLLIDPYDPKVLYTVQGNGIHKSTDGGQTMRRIVSGLPNQGFCCGGASDRIAPLSQRNHFVVALQYNGIFKTVNGGQTWQKVSHLKLNYFPDGDEDTSCHDGFCAPDQLIALTDDHYLLTTRNGTLFESVDAGQNWAIINDQFHRAGVDRIAVSGNRIYLSTSAGVFVRE